MDRGVVHERWGWGRARTRLAPVERASSSRCPRKGKDHGALRRVLRHHPKTGALVKLGSDGATPPALALLGVAYTARVVGGFGLV